MAHERPPAKTTDDGSEVAPRPTGKEPTVVFEVEDSGEDSLGWDPDDPYGEVEEYENRA